MDQLHGLVEDRMGAAVTVRMLFVPPLPSAVRTKHLGREEELLRIYRDEN